MACQTNPDGKLNTSNVIVRTCKNLNAFVQSERLCLVDVSKADSIIEAYLAPAAHLNKTC